VGFRAGTRMRRLGAGVVLMHTRGRPEGGATQPQLCQTSCWPVDDGLSTILRARQQAGIPWMHVLDPGYGFGKRFEGEIMPAGPPTRMLSLGRPLLAGLPQIFFSGTPLAPLFEEAPRPLLPRDSQPGPDDRCRF